LSFGNGSDPASSPRSDGKPTRLKNPFLIGERIYLRPLEREDAAIFVPWVNDQEIIRNLVLYRPMNRDNEEEFIARASKEHNGIVLGIALKKDDRLIGNTALHAVHSKNRNAGFGIMIGDKTEWNRGYGTEATGLMVRYGFTTLNLNRIWLHVHEYNPRGRRAYEKVGFQVEGTLRKHSFRDGRYWDVVVMGLLREEWEKKHPAAGETAGVKTGRSRTPRPRSEPARGRPPRFRSRTSK
jgi:diamine N-acetyltransferase